MSTLRSPDWWLFRNETKRNPRVLVLIMANRLQSSGPEVSREMPTDRALNLKFMWQSQTKISVWRQQIMTMAVNSVQTQWWPRLHLIKCNTLAKMMMKMGDTASRDHRLKPKPTWPEGRRNVRKARTGIVGIRQSLDKKCDRLQCAPNFNWLQESTPSILDSKWGIQLPLLLAACSLQLAITITSWPRKELGYDLECVSPRAMPQCLWLDPLAFIEPWARDWAVRISVRGS